MREPANLDARQHGDPAGMSTPIGSRLAGSLWPTPGRVRCLCMEERVSMDPAMFMIICCGVPLVIAVVVMLIGGAK